MTKPRKLDDDTLEVLRQAREAQANLYSVGINEEPEEEKVYETFMEINGLPSRSKFYSIKGQAPKVDDLLILSNIDQDNAQDKFTEVFKRRLRGIHSSKILSCDEIFLALWLREGAYPGLGYLNDVSFICPEVDCKKENKESSVRYQFKDIKFDIPDYESISDEFINGNGSVEIELPISKKKYNIH